MGAVRTSVSRTSRRQFGATASVSAATAAGVYSLDMMPTAAIGLIKHAINASGHHSLEQQLAVEAELQAQAAETEDYQEGRAAFLEKRKPRFIGR